MDIKYNYQFNIALSQGKFAWPGGYPTFFITADGAALSYDSAKENESIIRDAIIADDTQSGWRVVAMDINWEDTGLYCDHSGEQIPSAYGDDEGEE